MITEENVLKAIVDCKKPNGRTDYRDVTGKLEIDNISLLPFLNGLKEKQYITTTYSNMKVTALGISAYKDLTTKSKVKKSIFDFCKFSLKSLAKIIIEILVALLVAYLIYHFGWQ